MRVERPRVHAEAVERLWRAARAARLPHALCFEGPKGIGKFAAAKWLAQGLLCARGPGAPCGACGPCKRVLSGGHAGNHPDLLVLDPVEEDVEQIRVSWIAERPDAESGERRAQSLAAFLDLCAHESRWRPVLVREAQRMNAAAQNALLKTLEEPRPGTLLVLETHQPGVLLPTIRSRCVRVVYDPLPLEETLAVLRAAGLEEARARGLARTSGGSPGLALELAARGAEELARIARGVLAGELSAPRAAAAVGEVEGDYAGGTPSARERDRARVFLDLCCALLGDAQRRAAGVPADALAYGELVETLGGALDGVPLSRARAALTECRADVDKNLGPAALVVRACLVLAAPGRILAAS